MIGPPRLERQKGGLLEAGRGLKVRGGFLISFLYGFWMVLDGFGWFLDGFWMVFLDGFFGMVLLNKKHRL